MFAYFSSIDSFSEYGKNHAHAVGFGSLQKRDILILQKQTRRKEEDEEGRKKKGKEEEEGRKDRRRRKNISKQQFFYTSKDILESDPRCTLLALQLRRLPFASRRKKKKNIQFTH